MPDTANPYKELVGINSGGCFNTPHTNYTKRYDSLNDLSTSTSTELSARVDGFAFPFDFDVTSTAPVDGVYCIYGRGGSSTVPGRWLCNSPSVNVLEYGAKSDSTTDCTVAFRKALNRGGTILIPPSPEGTYYKISDFIITSGKTKLKVVATGAVIKNSDLTKPSFLFQSCSNVGTEGGAWGYVVTPTANSGGSQHVFQFDKCFRTLVNQSHILNSGEMGIAITQSMNTTVQNSTIEHCFRDGTYSHHSVNTKYISNVYNEIKDDAMSFHDYGLDEGGDRSYMVATLGYTQAETCFVSKCVVNKAYQGFASVGAKGVTIVNCKFNKTVLAGVSLMNQQYGKLGGTVSLQDARVESNTFDGCCTNQTINGVSLTNTGQSSTGRATIVCASLNGPSNSITPLGQPKRQSNIVIRTNTVLNSGALGIHCSTINGLNLSGNILQNCTVTGTTLSGSVVELWEINQLVEESVNTVIDTRTPTQHVQGVAYDGVNGFKNKWIVFNRVTSDVVINNSSALADISADGAINSRLHGFVNAQVATATSVFAFAHGASFVPIGAVISSVAPDSDQSEIKTVTTDASSVIVTFKTARGAGTYLAISGIVFK